MKLDKSLIFMYAFEVLFSTIMLILTARAIWKLDAVIAPGEHLLGNVFSSFVFWVISINQIFRTK